MATAQFDLCVGPFNFNVSTNCLRVAENISALYEDYEEKIANSEFIDFYVSVRKPTNIRRWFKPQVNFYFDEHKPFNPLPESQAYAMLEWGMNWCIANHAHQFFILHAAAIEKNGKGIILPAPPGSGKSTLCAAMAYNSWRLFSDELALVSMENHQLYPCTRPINLKNNSIDIMRNHVKNAVLSSSANDTKKGTVALLKPPRNSVLNMNITANPAAIVFPKYCKGSKGILKKVEKLSAFSQLIENSFNYHSLGLEGFNAVTRLLSEAKCFFMEYSQFEDANQMLTDITI